MATTDHAQANVISAVIETRRSRFKAADTWMTSEQTVDVLSVGRRHRMPHLTGLEGRAERCFSRPVRPRHPTSAAMIRYRPAGTWLVVACNGNRRSDQ